MLAVAAEGEQFPGLAVAQPVEEFLPGFAVTAHEADGDLAVAGVGQARQFEDSFGARAVDRDRLLHEDVETPLDRRGEVRSAERGGRGEDHDVAGPQAVDRLPKGRHPHEAAVVGHVDPFLELLAETPPLGVDLALEDVGHRHELQVASRHGERVGGGTGTPAAAAHEGDSDVVIPPRVHAGFRLRGRGGVFGPSPVRERRGRRQPEPSPEK